MNTKLKGTRFFVKTVKLRMRYNVEGDGDPGVMGAGSVREAEEEGREPGEMGKISQHWHSISQ